MIDFPMNIGSGECLVLNGKKCTKTLQSSKDIPKSVTRHQQTLLVTKSKK